MVTTISEVKKFIPTIDFKDFGLLESFIKDATFVVKTKLLGGDLYNEITSKPDDHEELVELCKGLICFAGYYDAIPFLNVTHTSQGIATVDGTNIVAASKDRKNDLKSAVETKRDKAEEDIFLFLEENVIYHDLWKSSKAYSLLKDCLIPTMTEFKSLTKWEGTRSEFVNLRSLIKLMTQTKLYEWFSKEYVEELILKIKDGTLREPDLLVLPHIQQYLANIINPQPGLEEMVQTIRDNVIEVMEEDLSYYPTYKNSGVYQMKIKEKPQNPYSSSIFMD